MLQIAEHNGKCQTTGAVGGFNEDGAHGTGFAGGEAGNRLR